MRVNWPSGGIIRLERRRGIGLEERTTKYGERKSWPDESGDEKCATRAWRSEIGAMQCSEMPPPPLLLLLLLLGLAETKENDVSDSSSSSDDLEFGKSLLCAPLPPALSVPLDDNDANAKPAKAASARRAALHGTAQRRVARRRRRRRCQRAPSSQLAEWATRALARCSRARARADKPERH